MKVEHILAQKGKKGDSAMKEADSDSDQSKEKGPPPAKKDLKATENQVVTHFYFQKIMMLTKSRDGAKAFGLGGGGCQAYMTNFF